MKITVILIVILGFALSSCAEPRSSEADAASEISAVAESGFDLSAEALAYLISGPGGMNVPADFGKKYASEPPVDELIAAGHVEIDPSPDSSRVTVKRTESGNRIHRLFVTRESNHFMDSLE